MRCPTAQSFRGFVSNSWKRATVFQGILGPRRWLSFLPICFWANYAVDLRAGSQPNSTCSLYQHNMGPPYSEGFRWIFRRNFIRRTERFNLSIFNDRCHILAVMWFSCLQRSGSTNLVVSSVVNFSKSWHPWCCIATHLSLCNVSQRPWTVAAC